MSARTTPQHPGLVTTTVRRSARAATPRDRRLFVGTATLAALSVAGAIISVASGLSDTIWEANGGYSDPDRSAPHIAYQFVFIAAIAVVGVLAAMRFISLLRHRR